MSGPMIMPMYSFYVYSLNRVTLRTGRVLSSPNVAGVDWVPCPPESTRVALQGGRLFDEKSDPPPGFLAFPIWLTPFSPYIRCPRMIRNELSLFYIHFFFIKAT